MLFNVLCEMYLSTHKQYVGLKLHFILVVKRKKSLHDINKTCFFVCTNYCVTRDCRELSRNNQCSIVGKCNYMEQLIINN